MTTTKERYTKNFTVAEMASKDGKDKEARMCSKFMAKLQALREDFQASMIITSAIRSKEHNSRVGGSPVSKHLTRPCIAADIDTSTWTGKKKHKFLDLVFQHGFNGIGVGENFIHLDTRAKSTIAPTLWTYD